MNDIKSSKDVLAARDARRKLAQELVASGMTLNDTGSITGSVAKISTPVVNIYHLIKGIEVCGRDGDGNDQETESFDNLIVTNPCFNGFGDLLIEVDPGKDGKKVQIKIFKNNLAYEVSGTAEDMADVLADAAARKDVLSL